MNKDKPTVLAILALASTGQLKPWQIRTAKQLMLDRLDTGISVTELAEACALSRSQFSRMFKESTRMSPQRWLREQRVMKSRELLKASTMLLAEIALECGFCDQSHFCRTFVKTEGMTPQAWQQQAICPIPAAA
ncbi:helix-turn-helix domain-containing protein [Pseudomonas sp. SCB32]|uniref:helix-turn-helix domain-containing protein n=1 Tax=Pseudomonas sp. SCB32 TaxID=2653853 RepID=UPI001264598F|nr:AraC family transcriptional regulator [Pseudomonas sp. SCB32]